jgi:hypothetical protein
MELARRRTRKNAVHSQLTEIVLPQIGFKFGFGPAPGKPSKTAVDTATIASASVLKIPQAPRPGV